MRFLPILLVFFTLSLGSFAQKGKIEGKVTDARNGNKITGVTIMVNGTKSAVATDVEGRFVLTLDAGKKYAIRITSVGYKSKELEEVEVIANQVTNIDIVLESASKTETGVVVRSSARKESAAALIAYQKNTAVVAQVISAEAIRRSPDKNTGEVLKRVPGTSIQEGKYIVVRGLADRYNQAMLNGVLLSSTEPDRKTFSFDIFPAGMIDNIIINKAFIPELPGEWAGGLIQVNTKDFPAKNFFSIQLGTGFNTQTIGKDFYTYEGSNTDFLGFDNGKRGLPANFPLKEKFNSLTQAEKTVYGSKFENIWSVDKKNSGLSSVLNQSFQISGGFNKKLGSNKKLAAIIAVNYNRSNKATDFLNRTFSFTDNIPSLKFDYVNDKYSQDVLAGALANISLQLGNNSKISFKNILNVNTVNYATLRRGVDYESESTGENIKATELAFKANTFFNTQLSGDHNINRYNAKLHWFGSFNILDQYVPDQRRIQYSEDSTSSLYVLSIGKAKTSQRSGSRYFGFLNDYIYTAGADISKNFTVKGLSQAVKAGYFFQVKDRLFDARPFAIYIPTGNNPAFRHLPADQVFAQENFGTGYDDKFAFNELYGSSYRYLANSILNAGFLQFDNQFTSKLRVTWGLRWENFDQLVGTVKKSDPNFFNSIVDDFLPGINITYKVNEQTNLRLSGSQTVIRPEFRELSLFQFYDFDLGATVAGNTRLARTKISNLDLRYELYPRSGELVTFGIFYKYFNDPIELFFNPGSGSASSFNYINADFAKSYGAEFEIRKKLDFSNALRNFTVQGNLSYIYNRVKSDESNLDRPMQGQSPYLINIGIQYDVEKMGLTTTLLFNQIGRRIFYVGSSASNGSSSNDSQPPVWEAPRPLIDFQVSKKIMKGRGEVKLNIADIINKAAVYYHDVNDNGKYNASTDALAIKRKYGTNVGISIGYNF